MKASEITDHPVVIPSTLYLRDDVHVGIKLGIYGSKLTNHPTTLGAVFKMPQDIY